MPDARLVRTTVEIGATSDDGRTLTFAATGKRIVFPGYLRAYVEGSDDPQAALDSLQAVVGFQQQHLLGRFVLIR